jgi:hypothetical protein
LDRTTEQQLIRVGAATHQLPASDYTGLVPGQSVAAYDEATSTYWAGAGLVPSPSSKRAKASVQDDGSYLVFERRAGSGWTAYNVGLSGVARSSCAVHIPAVVLELWHWQPDSCRPPS